MQETGDGEMALRIGLDAMTAALSDLKTLQYPPTLVSAYECYLVGKWFAAQGITSPAIRDADEAVAAIFQLDDSPQGRLSPFRWTWRKSSQSGQSTVWNQASNRKGGRALSEQLFNGHEFGGGLVADPEAVLAGGLVDQRLPARQALAALVLREHDFAEGADWAVAEAELQQRLGMTVRQLAAVTDDRPLGVPLLGEPAWSIEALPEDLRPTAPARVVQAPDTAQGVSQEVVPEVAIDPRTERMLRRAVRAYPAVLLVGPPGTGKGTLLLWLFNEIRSDPASFGMEHGPVSRPMWRTPDESWSAFELVGGLAPDAQGDLLWTRGVLPTAIGEDRWLVLDETNRADMDKIMGPLLTWLSGQDVEVGRSSAHGGKPVEFGWSDGASSSVVDDEQLRFLAGTDWRLLGTYNPQDAQLVFRFGMALARRFAQVPIPAIDRGQFETLLEDRHPGLSVEAATAIADLYEAHRDEAATTLGPAVFLRLVQYLSEGDDLAKVLAEAYVVSVGKYLATYDDATFEALRARVVDERGALRSDEWDWLSEQRNTLG